MLKQDFFPLEKEKKVWLIISEDHGFKFICNYWKDTLLVTNIYYYYYFEVRDRVVVKVGKITNFNSDLDSWNFKETAPILPEIARDYLQGLKFLHLKNWINQNDHFIRFASSKMDITPRNEVPHNAP